MTIGLKRAARELRKIEKSAQAGYDDPMTKYYGCGEVVADAAERARRTLARRAGYRSFSALEEALWELPDTRTPRQKWRDNYSAWRANVPGYPTFDPTKPDPVGMHDSFRLAYLGAHPNWAAEQAGFDRSAMLDEEFGDVPF